DVTVLSPTLGTTNRARLDHPGSVVRVAYSPDGKHLATAGVDQLIRVWDPATRRLEAKIAGHTGAVWSLSWSRDGQKLASASADGTVRIWEPRNWRDGDRSQTAANFSMSFSPDSKWLASGGHGLDLWNLHGEHVRTLLPSDEREVRVVFSPNGKTLA